LSHPALRSSVGMGKFRRGRGPNAGCDARSVHGSPLIVSVQARSR
jgi:hypothetical protein